MIKIVYSKDAKKTLDSYENKTAKRILDAIDKIPLGDIKKLVGNNVDLYLELELENIESFIFTQIMIA